MNLEEGPDVDVMEEDRLLIYSQPHLPKSYRSAHRVLSVCSLPTLPQACLVVDLSSLDLCYPTDM